MMNSSTPNVNRKRSSEKKISGSRKKRIMEPRPHPADCLNKKYWDDIRAGRIPKPNWIKTEQQQKNVSSPVFTRNFFPPTSLSQNNLINPFTYQFYPNMSTISSLSLPANHVTQNFERPNSYSNEK